MLAIPHNPNLAGGLMFRDPQSESEARDRLFFEPVIELTQHKASSECRFDRLAGRGVGTGDELCDFEQVVADNLSMLGSVHGEVMAEQAAPVPIDEFHRRNMIRNVLKDGLTLGQERGLNPFTMGFIGSTDTHSATPGAAEEDNYTGHLGRRDAGYRNVQDHFYSNPGGHAVVWAEENSRDAIFEGMRRKETYATSGTRPVVRFFGGAGLDEGALRGAGSRGARLRPRACPWVAPSRAAANRPALPGERPQGPGRRGAPGYGSPACPDREGLGRPRRHHPRARLRRGGQTPRTAPRWTRTPAAPPAAAPATSARSGRTRTSIRGSPPSTTCACSRIPPAAGPRSSARLPA